MATVKEAIEAQIAATKAKAEGEIKSLESQLAALPVEVHGLAEEVWAKIKSFLGVA